MTKEEFKKLHLCKNCVNGVTKDFYGVKYHYCNMHYSITLKCSDYTPLNMLYNTTRPENLRVVKKCDKYEERQV